MDDVTLSEIIHKSIDSGDSKMLQYITGNYPELLSKNNSMNVNIQKTKEMILGNIRIILQHRCVSGEMQ